MANGPPAGGRRVHVVLVPGFAGFDALGQLEYYAGVTPLFQNWKNAHKDRARVVLHYFDNFPTAAVATRAARLQRYLAKRIARGEFQDNDALVLVGHSTGGLDIRRLLLPPDDKPNRFDGSEKSAVGVDHARILDLVHGAVFLSVPQWGTNIADWVREYSLARHMVVTKLRAAVAGSQLPLLDKLENSIACAGACLTNADLFRALQDVLTEADASLCNGEPACTASAHEAASQVELWLRHIASDFKVIDDLAAEVLPHSDSPAHFPRQKRAQETALWKRSGIRTRSYATISKRPFLFAGEEAPRWEICKPSTYPCCTESAQTAGTGFVYRTCYRACAGGPFDHEAPAGSQLDWCPDRKWRARIERWGIDHLHLWDNDGIVNTASMFWPHGKDTLLVPGDHMDIVGHYTRTEAVQGTHRRYYSYDLLESASEFDDSAFEQVWNSVFDFCLESAKAVRRRAA